MPARPRQNRTPDGAKRRWTPDDRARRDAAPGRGRTQRDDASASPRAARREATFGRAGERSDRQDRRPEWFPGGRTAEGEQGRGQRGGRGERPQRDDRARRVDRDERPARDGYSARDGRPNRDERTAGGGRFGRDDRPRRDDRDQRDSRADRPFRAPAADRPFHEGVSAGDGRGRSDRAPRSFDDRPRRDDRAPRAFEDRARRDDRAPRSFDDRARRDDRAPRSFDDRPRRDDRAPRSFDDRPRRDDRAPRSSDDRARRDDRAPRSFDDRPRRDDRAPRSSEGRADHRSDRPRFERDERRRDDRPRSAEPRRHEGGWSAPEDVVLERLEAEVVTADEVAGSSFADLGLGPRITDALTELGAIEPFPIQAATIPDALAGRNVLGRGRTGSGKTIAFGAALVERLMRNWADSGRTGTGRRIGRAPRALVLAPTRELALQIDRTVQPLARAVGLYTTQIVGGVPQARQVGALGKGVDIVIGTPGRIEDLLEQRRLDLREIEIVVLDEADHMAELGFLEPMQRLLRRVPSGGQRMLFSATLDTAVAQLVAEFLPEPSVHEVAEPEGTGTADHRVLVIEQGAKLEVLTSLISSAERVLVFARTRAFAEQLTDELDAAGVKAESLHGDLNQARRTRNLQRFSEGRVAALVATDVAARGIHVDGIDLVIHADAAEDYKSYLHRSGRTGRAGASGTVVTLINARRRRRMTELLERAGIEAAFTTVQAGDDAAAAVRS